MAGVGEVLRHLAGQLRDAIKDADSPVVAAVAGELERVAGSLDAEAQERPRGRHR